MKQRLILLAAYFLNRAGELSTCLGLLALASAVLHKDWSDDQMAQMANHAVMAFGVIAAVFPDKITEVKEYARHFMAGTTPTKGDN